MRFVVKREEDKTEKLASPSTIDLVHKIATEKAKDKISDSIYRDAYDHPDGKKSKVENALAKSYYYKCAYCERICKADIEHYRPKKRVTNESSHDGYYWLCYEWTNLIPSCITCNREGAKHNHFPILGTRVTDPPLSGDRKLDFDQMDAKKSPLVDEIPFLLHPEVDQPEDFLKFEIDPANKGIRVCGIDTQGRGNKTIEICKLNRQELLLDRKMNVIDPFIDAINSSFCRLERGTITQSDFFKDLEKSISHLITGSQNEEYSYTLLRKYIVKSLSNFERIVLPFFLSKQRRILSEAFELSLL